MTLLAKIRDAAVDSKMEISVVLRQCAVLATRLKHDGFKKWVEEELNGYPTGIPLPPYRIVKGVTSIGHFMGAFGEQITNVPLPLSNVPAEIRERISQVEFRQGVGELQAMVVGHNDDLMSRWPPDLVARVAHRYFEGRTLMAAQMELPRSTVTGVLDAVRNRVLQFVLEIEDQTPDVGEVQPGTASPISSERVTQIFMTTIMGAANIAVGGQNVSQSVQVVADDIDSLRKYLIELGVPTPDVAELETALKQDGPPNQEGQFGPNISGWIGKMVKKAAEGAWKIAIPAAATILASGIRWYFGLP